MHGVIDNIYGQDHDTVPPKAVTTVSTFIKMALNVTLSPLSRKEVTYVEDLVTQWSIDPALVYRQICFGSLIWEVLRREHHSLWQYLCAQIQMGLSGRRKFDKSIFAYERLHGQVGKLTLPSCSAAGCRHNFVFVHQDLDLVEIHGFLPFHDGMEATGSSMTEMPHQPYPRVEVFKTRMADGVRGIK